MIIRPAKPLRRGLLLACVIGVTTCGRGDGTSALAFDVTLPAPVIIVPLDSELIAGASGMALDSAGGLWVADFRGRRLLSVRPDGSEPRLIGVEGAGPGEFRGPLGIVAGRDFVRVAEAFNNRLQDYALDGVHLRDHAPQVPMLGGAALRADGHLVVPRPYGDSALAQLYHMGVPKASIGSPPAPGAAYRPPDQQRLDAQAGVVPPEMRNTVITSIGQDAAYVLLVGEGVVWKFDQDGRTAWRTALEVPELVRIRNAFFAAARETEPSGFGVLMLMTQAVEVGAAVWVLLAGADDRGTVLYVLDGESGHVLGRIRVPTAAPALKFVVDRDRERLFLSTPDDASIWRADIAAVPAPWR